MAPRVVGNLEATVPLCRDVGHVWLESNPGSPTEVKVEMRSTTLLEDGLRTAYSTDKGRSLGTRVDDGQIDRIRRLFPWQKSVLVHLDADKCMIEFVYALLKAENANQAKLRNELSRLATKLSFHIADS